MIVVIESFREDGLMHDYSAAPPPTDEPTRQLTPYQAATGPKRLSRNRDKKLFMGVCAGLADYFDLDPTIIRIAFVAGSLLGGASLLVYLVLLTIMPAEDQLDADPRAAAHSAMDEAAAEIQRGFELVVDKARELTGRKSSSSTP